MEKKTKSISKSLPPVKLFLKDINKIYEIFNTLNHSVQLETEDHILESIEELSNIDEEKINNISYKISEPYISLQMSKLSIFLYASSDDYTSKGIFNELKNYLFSKRRKLHNIIESPFIAGFFNGSFLAANLFYIISVPLGLLATIALLLSIFYLKWVINQNTNWHTIIYLRISNKELSFFQRKKDEIILIVISSILGAILGALFTYLITK